MRLEHLPRLHLPHRQEYRPAAGDCQVSPSLVELSLEDSDLRITSNKHACFAFTLTYLTLWNGCQFTVDIIL